MVARMARIGNFYLVDNVLPGLGDVQGFVLRAAEDCIGRSGPFGDSYELKDFSHGGDHIDPTSIKAGLVDVALDMFPLQ